MSLSEYSRSSILLVSLDFQPDELTTTDKVIVKSETEPEVTDKERAAISEFLDRFLTNDSYDKGTRIPIIIDDRIIPAQHVGSSINMAKAVDYDAEDNITVTLQENSISVTIDIKNNITKVSSAADLLTGVIDAMHRLYTTYPRVSWFSATACIFNGYLTSVRRQTVYGTDRETVTLDIEQAVQNPEPDAQVEIVNANETPQAEPPQLEDTTGGAQAASSPSVQDIAPAPIEGRTNADGRLFMWYPLLTVEAIDQAPVPQIFGTQTVNRLPFEVYKTQGFDFDLQPRACTTLHYNDVNIPLNLNGNSPYYRDGYAVAESEGYLWLGVEAA